MEQYSAFILLAALLLAVGAVVYRRRAASERGNGLSSPRHPFHCVSVDAKGGGCDAARQLAGHRFLAGEAPALPLPGCTQSACACIYVHFEDRRHRRRRDFNVNRVDQPTLMRERRGVRGRRKTDLQLSMPH